MPDSTPRKCITCFGTGEVGGERGPEDCRDCHGTGQLASAASIFQERLRQIETTAATVDGDLQGDLRWLTFELRKSRSALIQVLAASQDLDDDDPLVKRIRFATNEALGLYETTEV
jgi:hypothetical protein